MKILRTSDGKILRCEPIPTNTGYGALYNWYAATDSRGIAPSGFHVPSFYEWLDLRTTIGGYEYGYKLKAIGYDYWDSPNTDANDYYGFNAKGYGSRDRVGMFNYLKQDCRLMTTTTTWTSMSLVYDNGKFWTGMEALKWGYSIRCLKNDSTYVPYVDDIDGNRYPCVKIGNQVWMAANLQVTHYNDGTAIPNVTDNTEWSNLTSGAYCIYNNDSQYISNIQGKSKILRVETANFYPKYGLLYNWYAATDARNISADGWVVPTLANIQTLSNYLGGDSISGGHLKETGITYWETPNSGADNSSGFNARASGRRKNNDGTFLDAQSYCNLITSTLNGLYFKQPQLSSSNDDFTTGLDQVKSTGASIRLLKSTTTLSNGQSGLYTGNDGKVYRTICIGTQEWLADNLAETKYRNGDSIPEVTDNSAWAALTSGAMCAYNNDWNNV